MTTRTARRVSPDETPLSALLYMTRGTYTEAVRRAQAAVGCADVPPAAEVLLNAMEWSGAPAGAVAHTLGISKQAVSQMVEALVTRGYLARERDPSDRRRVKLSLTERGRRAGKAGHDAIVRVDGALRLRVGAEGIARTRATLVALLEIKRAARAGAEEA